MALRFFIILVVTLVPLFAQAEGYRCEDRSYLEGVLSDLNARCGGSSSTVCMAFSYKGSTVEAAIGECSKVYSHGSCAQNVTCTAGAPVCEALQYKGSNVARAIDECSKVYAHGSCAQNVTCQNSSVCQALSYKGGTIEEAIAECSKVYAHGSCAQAATCN